MSDVEVVRRLLRAYAASLPFALDFQDFEAEVAGLPGSYAPPRGELLLDRRGGCVGIRALDGSTCEMKRLYVEERARGRGVGRLLAQAAVSTARSLGYERMRLDTVPGMDAAQALYAELGFREIPPYTANPVAGARFLELEL